MTTFSLASMNHPNQLPHAGSQISAADYVRLVQAELKRERAQQKQPNTEMKSASHAASNGSVKKPAVAKRCIRPKPIYPPAARVKTEHPAVKRIKQEPKEEPPFFLGNMFMQDGRTVSQMMADLQRVLGTVRTNHMQLPPPSVAFTMMNIPQNVQPMVSPFFAPPLIFQSCCNPFQPTKVVPARDDTENMQMPRLFPEVPSPEVEE
uniref:Protein FAR1-RELATED SEQUENCE n=1 Tax=Steinernema glaseri TaxID=37863 RepID=A0A1I7Y039_9BILA